MSDPTIQWIDDDFERLYVKRLVLSIPLEWYVDQKSDFSAKRQIAFWLCKMAWTLFRTGKLWK